ncbi:MAG: hypothetical protein ABGX51_07210, partial [Gammaproteobacteria bacterium]
MNKKNLMNTMNLFFILSSLFLLMPIGANAEEFFLADGVTLTNKLPELVPHEANEGAFEGGPTGTMADAGVELQVPEDEQRSGGGFNIPTGAAPSPL